MTTKQTNISSLFKAAATAKAPKVTRVAVESTAKTATVTPVAPTLETSDVLFTRDPIIAAFYASLSPSERIAHEIATEKLGTSYDVTRTHGFVRWQKSRG